MMPTLIGKVRATSTMTDRPGQDVHARGLVQGLLIVDVAQVLHADAATRSLYLQVAISHGLGLGPETENVGVPPNHARARVRGGSGKKRGAVIDRYQVHLNQVMARRIAGRRNAKEKMGRGARAKSGGRRNGATRRKEKKRSVLRSSCSIAGLTPLLLFPEKAR